MTDEQPEVVFSIPSATRRIEVRSDDKTQTFYANNVQIELSNWDLKLRFGIIQSAAPELLSILDVAHVYMSHSHALIFADSLNKVLGQLEKTKQQIEAGATKNP